MKKIIALSGALALGLSAAGCAQLQQLKADIQTQVPQDLPSVCAGIATGDAIFQTIVATQARAGKPLAAKVISDEATAVAAASVPCANPTAPVSAGTVIATALGIYAVIMDSLATAQGAQ